MKQLFEWLQQRSSSMWSPCLLQRWFGTFQQDLAFQLENGNSFLHELVTEPEEGMAEVVQFLIAKGASPNCRNAARRTPLHEIFEDSCHHGLGWYELAVVRSLVEGDAEVDAKDAAGDTVLHKVMRRLHVNGRGEFGEEIVEFLIDSGADCDAKNRVGESPRSILDDWLDITAVDNVLDRLDGLHSPAETFVRLFPSAPAEYKTAVNDC